MVFDYAIVGGGIAGLYAAYRLRRLVPGATILLLEQDPDLGGRAKPATFHGAKIVTGAGIGRRAKDVRLLALLRELGLPAPEFPATHTSLVTLPCRVRKAFLAVRNAYEALPAGARPAVTFREFAEAVLGPDAYQAFVDCSGYSDFEAADVQDVLYRYGFEDNYASYTGVAVPWGDLIQALASAVAGSDQCTIVRDCRAIRLVRPGRPGSDPLQIHCGDSTVYTARRIIIAAPINAIRSLLPHVPVFTAVHGQPFLRLYAAFSGASARAMRSLVRDGVNIVGRPLQKVIPMSRDAGVYMVAYADNDSAVTLSGYMADTARNRRHVAAALEQALGQHHMGPRPLHLRIDSLRGFYFPSGTHYFAPIAPETRSRFMGRVRNPVPGVWVVGEAVSSAQGWTEGALESVDVVLPSLT